jgi:hypothetical protein
VWYAVFTSCLALTRALTFISGGGGNLSQSRNPFETSQLLTPKYLTLPSRRLRLQRKLAKFGPKELCQKIRVAMAQSAVDTIIFPPSPDQSPPFTLHVEGSASLLCADQVNAVQPLNGVQTKHRRQLKLISGLCASCRHIDLRILDHPERIKTRLGI